MSKKTYAAVGFAATALFWVTYLVMASRRPGYSFMYKAISELGSLDAPHKWIWNVLGYILPGTMIAAFAVGLYTHMAVDKPRRLPFAGIFLSGVCMAVAGLFPGDFDNRESLTMLLHTVGSFGSYVFFLVGAFSFPAQARKNGHWQAAVGPGLAFTWLTIIFGSWVFVFPAYPAVGQRFVFLFYFAWIVLVAYRLYTQPTQAKPVS